MKVRDKQERIWIARSLHTRIKALKKRRGLPMVELANRLIRRGLQEFRDDELRPGR